MPATGGSPTAVYSSGLLTGGLTADGTRVYFTVDDADAGMDLHSVLPDGGMEQTLASFLDVIGSTASKPCALSVAAGNVYMAATTTTGGTPAIYSVPIDGGPPRLDVASPTVSELLWADSSGIYFSYQDEDAGTGYVFGYAPLGGGPLSAMGTEPPGTGMGGAGWTGDFVVAAGSAYFIQASPPAASQPTPAALMKLVPPSGPLVRVATYPDEQAILDTIALVGDSRGLYEIQAQGVGWGIYEIDPSTGVRTLLAGDPSAGAPYDAENIGDPAAIDATNVYFTEISASGFSIWALPR